jgi:hypothetical protein
MSAESMLDAMALSDELEEIAGIAGRYATDGEHVAAILATEPRSGERVYLCAFDGPAGRTWLALTADGNPVESRDRLRDAISIAAVVELAEESADTSRAEPRVASPAYLDELGGANAEVALALQHGVGAVDELTREVETGYKLPLT